MAARLISTRLALDCAVERVAGKDQAGLSLLRELTYERLLKLAMGILGSVEDAEDALILVYLQIWQNASKFDPSRGAVMPWLYAICRGRSIDLRRHREMWRRQDASYARVADDLPSYVADPQDLLEHVQDRHRARRALKSLPAAMRRIVELSYFDELSHQEIANRTHLALGTIKTHVRRSLPKLRREMAAMPN